MALLNQTQQDYYDGNDFGGYQFISLNDIITNFTIAYVGEHKIISKAKRTDIAFHAQRAIQELSFDTFKCIKSQEITLPPSNTMVLPQDYVNYTKICWVDDNGIERPLYPTKHTSNPTPILQNEQGDYNLTAVGTLSNSTNIVALDKEYKNILVGMQVDGTNFNNNLNPLPNIPLGTIVGSVVHNAGITTISLVDYLGGIFPSIADVNDIVDSAGVTPDFSGDETLTFRMFPEPFASNGGNTAINENLVIETGDGVVLDGVTYSINEDKITAASANDASQVSIGMYVSHSHATPGTKVVAVNGTIITVDNIMLEDSTESTFGSTNQITFITIPSDSQTWNNYTNDTKSSTGDANGYNHDTDIYDLNIGRRYGVHPETAQGNGSYYIDELKGKIHFSSNVGGKNVILKYISDGLGTNAEMIVHKFAEEAMYKSIAYAILSTRIDGQALVPRFKREKFAAIRTAKIRLSNIKTHELIQVLRGKSKWIK
tara:strand:+ start:768 stop:2225 length:1458 start_codon:yes stop_codon:yes gene_type:complete